MIRENGDSISKRGRRLSPAHLADIELAPQRYREALASNAAAGRWSVELTERMARSLRTMSPEQAAQALRAPAVPVRPAEEGPEKGAPMVALETVLRNQRPPHLDPVRARGAAELPGGVGRPAALRPRPGAQWL